MVQTAQGSNAKVFHQHEFIQAGFSPEGVEKVWNISLGPLLEILKFVLKLLNFVRISTVFKVNTVHLRYILEIGKQEYKTTSVDLFEFVFLQSLHGRQDERILHELKEWNNSFISVQQFMDDLAVAKGRIRSIQEEVSGKDTEFNSQPPYLGHRQLFKNAI